MNQPRRINRYLNYLIYQVVNIISPIILLPFLTRTLGPEKIGIINFYDGLGQTFITICSAGVLVVATREMSKSSSEEVRKSEVSAIFKFHLILTIFGIIALFFYTINYYNNVDYTLLFLTAFIVFLSAFKLDYVFQGLNKFGFIAKRSLIIRFIFVLSVILIVRNPNDFIKYFSLLAISSLFFSLISFIYSFKHIYFFKYFNFNIVKLGLKKSYKISLSNIITGIYSNLDVLLLVKFVTLKEVGIYVLGIKLVKFLSGIINSYAVSEYPTMTKLYFEGKIEKLHQNFRNSFLLILIITIPISILFSIYAPLIVNIVSGSSFIDSSIILRYTSTFLIFTTLNALLINQLAIMHKDLNILLYAFIGLIFGVIFLLFFINKFGIFGAAISILSIEIICNIYLILVVIYTSNFKFDFFQYFKIIFIALITFIAPHYILKLIVSNEFLLISISTIIGFVLYYFTLIMFSIPVNTFTKKEFWIKN